MPIKTQELCSKCNFGYGPTCFEGNGCHKCAMKNKKGCLCLTIKKGQNCPYFSPKDITAEVTLTEKEGVTVKASNVSPIHYAVSCLICGETIRYIEHPANIPEICDKCKAAVMAVRKRQNDAEKAALERLTMFPILD